LCVKFSSLQKGHIFQQILHVKFRSLQGGTHLPFRVTCIILDFQCKLNLNICRVLDYNTNPWSTNIKWDNFTASCKSLNHSSKRLEAHLPFTWATDIQTVSRTDRPTV
jgi:hypothetical protein